MGERAGYEAFETIVGVRKGLGRDFVGIIIWE